MKQVVIATNNENKIREIRQILDIENFEFLSLNDADISSDPEENADSFEGNARIKAKAVFDRTEGYSVLADDSGLEVDALGGAPGVYSSRFAGEEGNDEANNALLLEKLDGVPYEERTARFICTLVFIDESGREYVAKGSVEGKIGYEEHGGNGFGYDPLFLPDAYSGDKTFAQASSEEKNSLSHRGNALLSLKKMLVECNG